MCDKDIIKELSRYLKYTKGALPDKTKEAIKGAINALSPKKPKKITVNEDGYGIGNCPNCERLELHVTERCMCGQKLDWSEYWEK